MMGSRGFAVGVLSVTRREEILVLRGLTRLSGEVSGVRRRYVVLCLGSFVNNGTRRVSTCRFSGVARVGYSAILEILGEDMDLRPLRREE